MEGWICLHRKIREWAWYSDRNTCAIFLELLLTANYHLSNFRGIEIPIGGVVTGRESLAYTLGISEQNVRTALNHLKSTNEITIKTYSKFSVITIVNWEMYQLINQQTNQHLTSNEKTSQPRGENSSKEIRETAHKSGVAKKTRENQPAEKSDILNTNNELFESCKNNQPASNQQLTTSNKETINKEVVEVFALESEADKKINSKRGTRLPDDWELSQEWGDWAEAQGVSSDEIILQAKKFKNHWLSTAKNPTKRNWKATWENWIYSHLERKNNDIQAKRF